MESSSFSQRCRAMVRLASALILLASATSLVSGQDAEAPPLPLKRVALFSAGVGYFEHGGEVVGAKQVAFKFKTEHIDDLLKSLVVQDQDGGFVTAVNYGSPRPLSDSLRKFAVDLTDAPTLAEILQQLRGRQVRLEAPSEITGTILGVEIRKAFDASKQSAEYEAVNLRTDDGIQSVPLERVQKTKFLDPKIDADFQQALAMIAGERDHEQRRIALHFRGEGARQVRVGYIQESPVWKVAYRLVVRDDAPAFLQGWVIVENTTAQDWQGVELALVSGRPISFTMDLHRPLFARRPHVVPELHQSLFPRTFGQDLGEREQRFSAAGMGGMGGLGGGAFAGGMGGGMGGGADAEPPPREIDPEKGVVAVSFGEQVGELFRYAIKEPVTLPRDESAMLPIVNDPVGALKIAVFNEETHRKHPLSAIKLTNETSLHWMQGPVTVFDAGEYAGEAQIEDIAPSESRLVGYGLDLECEIVREPLPTQKRTASMRIRNGALIVASREIHRVRYVVKNGSRRAKRVWIEVPLDADGEGWDATDPKPVETTRDVKRYETNVEPNATTTLIVTHERTAEASSIVREMTLDSLIARRDSPDVPEGVKRALVHGIELRTAILKADQAMEDAKRQSDSLASEQERVRKNLVAIKESKPAAVSPEATKKFDELLNRWLTLLADIETKLEANRQELSRLKEAASKAHEVYERKIESTNAE